MLPIAHACSKKMAEKRLSRPNTIDEKRRMRNAREKRRRTRAKVLEAQLKHERTLKDEATKKVTLYKNMSRSYWERWQWELQDRKECMARERALTQAQSGNSSTSDGPRIHEIDPDLLHNPDDVSTYIGRGSFGVVRMQVYCGIEVAVKELLPRTLATDVRNEARVFASFCHPYLPLSFGVHTASRPYKIVMQYHGLNQSGSSATLQDIVSKVTMNVL